MTHKWLRVAGLAGPRALNGVRATREMRGRGGRRRRAQGTALQREALWGIDGRLHGEVRVSGFKRSDRKLGI